MYEQNSIRWLDNLRFAPIVVNGAGFIHIFFFWLLPFNWWGLIIKIALVWSLIMVFGNTNHHGILRPLNEVIHLDSFLLFDCLCFSALLWGRNSSVIVIIAAVLLVISLIRQYLLVETVIKGIDWQCDGCLERTKDIAWRQEGKTFENGKYTPPLNYCRECLQRIQKGYT